MVQANSANNNIRVKATTKTVANNAVETSNSQAKQWADVAKSYAESAQTSEQNVNSASAQIAQAASSALSQITESKNTAISEIEKLYPDVAGKITKVSELENDAGYLTENDTIKVQSITQEAYNELKKKDNNTLYIIYSHFLIWGTSLWGTGIWGLNDE
nr:MAG TPA: hypothetical protein [Caudoviricetes sp.]